MPKEGTIGQGPGAGPRQPQLPPPSQQPSAGNGNQSPALSLPFSKRPQYGKKPIPPLKITNPKDNYPFKQQQQQPQKLQQLPQQQPFQQQNLQPKQPPQRQQIDQHYAQQSQHQQTEQQLPPPLTTYIPPTHSGAGGAPAVSPPKRQISNGKPQQQHQQQSHQPQPPQPSQSSFNVAPILNQQFNRVTGQHDRPPRPPTPIGEVNGKISQQQAGKLDHSQNPGGGGARVGQPGNPVNQVHVQQQQAAAVLSGGSSPDGANRDIAADSLSSVSEQSKVFLSAPLGVNSAGAKTEIEDSIAANGDISISGSSNEKLPVALPQRQLIKKPVRPRQDQQQQPGPPRRPPLPPKSGANPFQRPPIPPTSSRKNEKLNQKPAVIIEPSSLVYIDQPNFGPNGYTTSDSYGKVITTPGSVNGKDGEEIPLNKDQEGQSSVTEPLSEVLSTPELEASFSSPYSGNAEKVYTIGLSAASLFTSISSSRSNQYDFEGWLTDGDPLKDLPPLRPTTSYTPLKIRVVETEAPKTVTYQNEWQTPVSLPTVNFIPQEAPPPASNFEREWTAWNSQFPDGEGASIIKPTASIGLEITETEAPKTVTYASEWFVANTLVLPSVQQQQLSRPQYQSPPPRLQPGTSKQKLDSSVISPSTAAGNNQRIDILDKSEGLQSSLAGKNKDKIGTTGTTIAEPFVRNVVVTPWPRGKPRPPRPPATFSGPYGTVEEVELPLQREENKLQNPNAGRKKTAGLIQGPLQGNVKKFAKQDSNGSLKRPSNGRPAAVERPDDDFQTSPSTDDPIFQRPERTTGRNDNQQLQQQQQLQPAVDPSGPGLSSDPANLKPASKEATKIRGTVSPSLELETVNPQSYDPFLEYLDIYPDFTRPNSDPGQFGSKPGFVVNNQITAAPKQNDYSNGITVSPDGYSGFQGVGGTANGFLTNQNKESPEISTIQANSDGYSGFIDRFTTVNPINEVLQLIEQQGANNDNTENPFQTIPLNSQSFAQLGSQQQNNQGLKSPILTQSGQEYSNPHNSDQIYQPNQDQGQGPFLPNNVVGYSPFPNQGQVYPPLNTPGQTNPPYQDANVLLPHRQDQGNSPQGFQVQNYSPATDLSQATGFGLSILQNEHQEIGENNNSFDTEIGTIFEKGTVEDISPGEFNNDNNGFLPTQRNNPGRIRLPTRPSSSLRPIIEAVTISNNVTPISSLSEGIAAFGQIPVIRTGNTIPQQPSSVGNNAGDLDDFLEGSLAAEGDEKRTKPKRKYETVSRGVAGGGNTKGEPTFINIDVTATSTTMDPPASR
jgi:hypothetical protein